ncbi:amino acid permease [Ornithinimicrobium flavum]|uniref:amino acid permease n=1 Tax=Ornithinimicrobium flavum TaxID=1288636 RepID=UPI0019310629|nr:amino acid permease [Ornithinimicrobium flavum]
MTQQVRSRQVPPPGGSQEPRLGVFMLTALVVGSMVGAGIFSIPQNMAAGPAAPGALLIGWLVTGVGMLALALTFQFLGRYAEDPEGGLHGYARDGFGPLPGFLAAWGYWISAWLGNLAYLVLIFSTVGLFFPVFGDGTNWPAIAAGSVLLWLYTFLLLRGVREAGGVNTVVTAAKLIPLLIFVVLAAVHFDPAVFTADLWGQQEGSGRSSTRCGP